MVQASLATRSQSFDLVKTEIEQTIKQTETSLERFQENRESGEDLQNCVDFLNQLRGIFILVELRGGILLCKEAVEVSNEVPVGANDDKNTLLTALNSALFTLRRYVEFHAQEREDHPELLLPVINELREVRKESPFPDSHFFEIDVSDRPDCCASLNLAAVEGSDAEREVFARRMRLMYQIALLGLLRNASDGTSRKLIARAAKGFARLSRGESLGQLWCLLAVVAETMQDRAMGFSKARKRLIMRIERFGRDLVLAKGMAVKKDVPADIFRDLVYILYRSGSANPEVLELLRAYGLEPAEYTEAMLESHARRLYGPGADVLRPLSIALQEELNQLKDKLDIIERGIEPDLAELLTIASSLERLANTLTMLDLSRLAEVARAEAARLRQWEAENRLPAGDELYSLADAVLSIEDAVVQLVSHGIRSETDALARARGQNRREESIYLREALIVVADEARSALTLAKRAITAFVESDYDKLHLANLPATMQSIWGGFSMLEDDEAARVLARIGHSIQDRLLDEKSAPSPAVLEALADALTSLEYYIVSIGKHEARNLDLLRLAESSLDDGGL